MKKDDYRSEFEEHRQKIELDEEPTVSKTRAELYRKKRKPKKKSRNVMINVIFALFTLIPIIIIAFVIINWYLDSDNNTTAAQDPRVKYETSTNKIKPNEKNNVAKDEEVNEKDIREEPQKVEEKDVVQEKEKPVEAEEKVEEKAEEKVEEKAEATPTPPTMKTHTVAAGETIYSISVTHYQSGKGVDKIKQVNGLTTNEIYVGQVLIIP